MKIVILGSGQLLIELLNECKLNFQEIEILGVCNLSSRKKVAEETQIELDKLGIRTLVLNKEELKKADLVLSFNCSVILQSDIVNNIDIINMHVGVLPKYRGNSANTWAIMNGEPYIGYTIHKMVDMLDAGDIYYVGKIPIGKKQTYSDVYDDLMNSIVRTMPNVLLQIYSDLLPPMKQEGGYVYCTMFSKEMGYIKGFDMDAEYIFNLFRCMARPHGSGIYFYKNEEVFETRKVLLGTEKGVCDYIGIPGKIVNVLDNMIWVKTRDNVIIFGDIYDLNNTLVDVQSVFRNGQMLFAKR